MRYVLITGGQMYNKGAQAMTFTVVNECKRYFPDSTPVLLSSVPHKRVEGDTDRYNFVIMEFGLRLRLALSGRFFRLLNKIRNYGKFKTQYKDAAAQLKEYFANADCLIDISGLALSSQMGFRKSVFYLLGIAAAKNYNVPVYIFPQSFGPFNYPKTYQRLFINFLMKKFLSYPKAVFAREKEGLNSIQKFCKNVRLSPDLVLQNKHEIDKSIIFKQGISEKQLPDIPQNSAAIVPNEKTFIHGNGGKTLLLLNEITKELLKNNLNVFLIPHSTEDLSICEKVKSGFSNDNRVILISEEFNCIELQNLISKFNFIVASRYHSIVHAYLESIPVITLGWAEKYKELLGAFNQAAYLFDVRQQIDVNKITYAINDMITNQGINREKIKTQLGIIQENSVFDCLKGVN
ncbi:polysaccharide pyruvyl transferase family protein [Geovibrio thiophilus]|uniref:Polysaccharide pyruvyl transferase family protein n=1 Tax=Geovibrio thiophilus TaxID=139438 RepID=A0A3R5V0H5_9BACT|nr:polysaccharide pyruvyl transferase family protein [Geovibrio thiophilus]QAR34192.1 polysaccharide pyruvyl transferase family protein [Geovibrio thiophilus]